MFDSFSVNICYHKLCYIKYTINLTAKSDNIYNDKEEENKYLIDEVSEKLNRTLDTCIIRYKEAFFLHHILEYLKELCDGYGNEPVFTHSVSLKRELIEKFFPFFPSAKFIKVQLSALNSCEYSFVVLKGQVRISRQTSCNINCKLYG